MTTSENQLVRKVLNPKSTIKNLICFSHLRWDFVYQRPQHLLSRFSKNCAVYFIEEPVFGDVEPKYTTSVSIEGVHVLVPHLPNGLTPLQIDQVQADLLDSFLAEKDLSGCAFWYYTPMALRFSRQYTPAVTIFDCMDELSAFKFAPRELKELESELLSKADVVFTGGHSLYNAKKDHHSNIHPFPSSIDKQHFRKARHIIHTPVDQENIPGPRIGFFGVIDERFDIELIDTISRQRPNWHIVLIGPVVKIDPATLPQRENIHYLGGKSYYQLPEYLAGWDIAMIPFLLNESTRFISPTKTPEYLAAGIPVISTPIHDVVDPYGKNGLVHIADTPAEFITAAEKILNNKYEGQWLEHVDEFLQQISWDDTVKNMWNEIEKTL